MILARYGGSCAKCYQLGKNQMQFSPSKLCFKRRARFVRAAGIRVVMLDLLGNRRWCLLLNSSCVAVLPVHLFARYPSSSWTPWLFWTSFVQNTEVLLSDCFRFLQYSLQNFFFFCPTLGNSGVLDSKANWDWNSGRSSRFGYRIISVLKNVYKKWVQQRSTYIPRVHNYPQLWFNRY